MRDVVTAASAAAGVVVAVDVAFAACLSIHLSICPTVRVMAEPKANMSPAD